MKAINIAFAFEVNGETLDPSKIEDPSQKSFIETIVESVYDRVHDIKCTEHNELPRFLFSGPSLEELSLEVYGCCDNLVELVKTKLDAEPPQSGT
jgi:hypothetical protein